MGVVVRGVATHACSLLICLFEVSESSFEPRRKSARRRPISDIEEEFSSLGLNVNLTLARPFSSGNIAHAYVFTYRDHACFKLCFSCTLL